MRFERVSIPATDPDALSDWYGRTLGVETGTASVELGATTLDFQPAAEAAPQHLAVRSLADIDALTAWLAERATIHPVEGAQSRRFDFLDADAVYFADGAGNVLECLCYDADAGEATPGAAAIAGVTEVGLPAPDVLALVEWLESAVGLSAWGSPSESFAWVGDREARFVVLPAGSEWYPTEKVADSEPISVSVVDSDATPGTYEHPELPYEITVAER
ncbi:VOC family protein [Halonotius terrestris]|uniref:VOC family protein n=1 Tax=Halonotius terrestris TaxID=2487750 RepID=A0A8J8PB39_9EURY|nr:VOC family protein [Halonotius terrestris]TQQ79975.1 VOC family protein [Halonotius terrestris]